MSTIQKIVLTAPLADTPPTEFRIFTAGAVDTKKGIFLFDSKAAKLVLAEYQKHGIDLMIDYDHASLGADVAVDPAQAGKAAGWFNLELRNGELWAVNVRWTPPAAAALARKEWRFMSPAFSTDKHGRVTALLNVALTNIPATRRLDPLVAASTKGKEMHPDLIKQALDAIEAGDPKKAMELLKGMIADAAGAGPDAGAGGEGSEGDGAEGVAPPAAQKEGVTDPKVVDAAAPPADDSDDEDKPEKKAENKAMRAMLCRLTGASTFASALVQVGDFKMSHVALENERQKLAAERETLESAERRNLVVTLVKLGAEFPATVWADDKATTIKPRWAKMPLAELRAHVSEQSVARKAVAGKKDIKPGSNASADPPATVELSADELAICKSLNCDPKDFAALKAFRDGKKGV